MSDMHDVKFEGGSDPRNHIARCRCGWAYSGTYGDIRRRALLHEKFDSQHNWHSPRRLKEADEKWGNA